MLFVFERLSGRVSSSTLRVEVAHMLSRPPKVEIFESVVVINSFGRLDQAFSMRIHSSATYSTEWFASFVSDPLKNRDRLCSPTLRVSRQFAETSQSWSETLPKHRPEACAWYST